MKTIGSMKFYTHDEMLDKVVGKKNSPARDKFENEVNNFLIGDAIKRIRMANHLTQEQLGERMGVKRAQISKIENGKCITYSTIVKAFKAMGIKTASLDLGTMGKIALW